MEKALKGKKAKASKITSQKTVKTPTKKSILDNFSDPMLGYVLIELSVSTLGNLVAYTGRETYLEKKKEKPNLERIAKLDAFYKEISVIDHDCDNFFDDKIMRGIVEKYCPIMKKINSGQDPFK